MSVILTFIIKCDDSMYTDILVVLNRVAYFTEGLYNQAFTVILKM